MHRNARAPKLLTNRPAHRETARPAPSAAVAKLLQRKNTPSTEPAPAGPKAVTKESYARKVQRLKQERSQAQVAARDAKHVRQAEVIELRRQQDLDRTASEEARALEERRRAREAEEKAERDEALRREEEAKRWAEELSLLEREEAEAIERAQQVEDEVKRLRAELRALDEQRAEAEAALEQLMEEQRAREEAEAAAKQEIERIAAEVLATESLRARAERERLGIEWSLLGERSKMLESPHHLSDEEKESWRNAFGVAYRKKDIAGLTALVASLAQRISDLEVMAARFAAILKATEALPSTGERAAGHRNMSERIREYAHQLAAQAPALGLMKLLDAMEDKLEQYIESVSAPTQEDAQARRRAQALALLTPIEHQGWGDMMQNAGVNAQGRLINAHTLAMDLPQNLRDVVAGMKVGHTIRINGRQYTLTNSNTGGLGLHTPLPNFLAGARSGSGERKSFIIHLR